MGVYRYDPTNQVLEPVAASSTDFGGATASSNGTHGLVPAPTSADVQKFLSAKGTWEYAGNIFYGTRTEWNQLTSTQKAIFSSDNMGIVCLYNDGIFEYDVTNDTLIVLSSRGHVIKNESGTAFTERTNLQIKNGFVSDDSTNDATIIESDNFVGTQAEWNALSAAQQAKYKSRDITDDSYETEDKSQLTTQDKSSLVGAINEVNSKTIVNQNDVYGYINSNNVFVPFKSQADIDAAVAAARVGNATAADVRKGKTFTNASGSGLTGTLVTEPFQAGKLSTRRNIDGWSDTWTAKTWNGLTDFSGNYTWTDGTNIYYSSSSNQYVLDKVTSTWTAKTWNGLTNFSGSNIWSDGTNIYYSNESSQYILNKSTSTWSTKTWYGEGTNYIVGNKIWTDGSDIYNTDRNNRIAFKLDISTSTWSWFGDWGVTGDRIWTDGTSIYYGTDKEFNKSNSTWSNKTWSGTYPSTSGCSNIWTDGDNIYYSSTYTQYILNKATLTWSNKTWNGLTSFMGMFIWTDGDNIYYSSGSTHYVLTKVKTHWVI